MSAADHLAAAGGYPAVMILTMQCIKRNAEHFNIYCGVQLPPSEVVLFYGKPADYCEFEIVSISFNETFYYWKRALINQEFWLISTPEQIIKPEYSFFLFEDFIMVIKQKAGKMTALQSLRKVA